MRARYFTVVVMLLAGASRAGLAAEPQPAPAGARTLKTITIEGAVDVPQVLFITSRANARFDDGLARWYLTTTADPRDGDVLPLVLRPYPFASDDPAGDTAVPASPAEPEAKE